MSMPKIKVNDISMYYEMHGHGEPVVFIGGLSADHLGWAGILDKFAHDYQVILFDNRGAGQTDAPAGPYTISQMTQDTAALCAALHIQHAHFIGNSMGGYIVQTLAHQYPSLIKSLVISNSATQTKTPFHYFMQAYLGLMKANAPRELLLQTMCCWGFSYHFLSKPGMLAHLIDWGKNNPNPITMLGYEGQYAAADTFDSSAWVDKISAPTLVIASDQDLVLPQEVSKELADRIHGAQFYCFQQCGHLPHIEQPDEYARVVKGFLGGVLTQ